MPSIRNVSELDPDHRIGASPGELHEKLHQAMPPTENGRIMAVLHEFVLKTAGLPFFRILDRVYPLIRAVGLERVVLYFARRWVVGTKTDEAIRATRRLQKKGLSYTMDILGEEVTEEAGADHALREYQSLLNRLLKEFRTRHISVKLSQLGLAINTEHCIQRMRALLDDASRSNATVTIDMEQYALKDKTLHIFQVLLADYQNVRICLQAYLHDSPHDLRQLLAFAREHNRELFIRLCKGAYTNQEAEWAEKGHYRNPVLPSKEQTDEQYLSLAQEMLGSRDIVYSAFATHDERLILKILHTAETHRISRKRYEFQLLYGIRPDLAEGLANLDYHTRIYVPFGSESIPYVIRRLMKNPANVEFLIGSLRG